LVNQLDYENFALKHAIEVSPKSVRAVTQLEFDACAK
jgi:hypothetical protein